MSRPYIWELARQVREAWRATSYMDDDLRNTLDRMRNLNELQDGCRLKGPMWTGRETIEHLLGLLVPETPAQYKAVAALWQKLNTKDLA